MVWILITLAALMIIGPALVLLPSTRQKEQMALRRAATARGITVELCTIDDPDPMDHLEDYTSSLGKALPRVIKCIAYKHSRQRTDDWRRTPQHHWKLVRRSTPGGSRLPKGKLVQIGSLLPAGWEWQDTDLQTLPANLREALITKIATLPADVIAVDETDYIVSVYWREKGGVDALQLVGDFLKSISVIKNDLTTSVEE